MPGIRRRVSRALALPLATLVAFAPAAAQTRCATPEERTAFEVRALRTELMVAWLSCRALPGRDFLGQMNGFLQRHRAGLQRLDVAFTGHFERHYGGQGRRQLDQYVTSLANDYSRVTMGAPNYCDDQIVVFQLVDAIDQRDLASFASERAALHPQFVPPSVCGTTPARSVQQRAPAAKTPPP